jgi:hypothetical protein
MRKLIVGTCLIVLLAAVDLQMAEAQAVGCCQCNAGALSACNGDLGFCTNDGAAACAQIFGTFVPFTGNSVCQGTGPGSSCVAIPPATAPVLSSWSISFLVLTLMLGGYVVTERRRATR